MWEYLKELLLEEIENNEDMQEEMEESEVTKEMIVSDQAFFKHLDAILKMKGSLSDKNCDDYSFEYEYKNVSCNGKSDDCCCCCCCCCC